MSIRAITSILNNNKLDKAKKKPITLLFKNDLTSNQRVEFLLIILSYFIFIPSIIVLLFIQSNIFDLSIFNIFFAILLPFIAIKALYVYVENLQYKYREILYKNTYDPDDVENVFALFGAVLTHIRTYKKPIYTQDRLCVQINGKLKLMGERKIKGIFAEMNKIFEHKKIM